MAKTLSVDEKNVMEFLRDGATNSFLIPDYQRKYDWDTDNVNLLFDDLKEFAENQNNNGTDDKYFLGTIVSWINGAGEREIIDGQQRIVSLLMLLRAIYTKLSTQEARSDDVNERLKEIQTTIWRRLNKGSTKVDYGKNYIRSESIDDGYKDSLQSILTTGRAASKNKRDAYSINYKLLQSKYDELYRRDQSLAEWFIYYTLQQTIIFSIEAATRDTALTIFSTINDRGKSLSDIDIVRSKIYGSLNKEQRKSFNEGWSNLVSRLQNMDETMDDILENYMYYVRALNGDTNQTSKSLKNYFSQEQLNALKDKDIIRTLDRIVDFWSAVNKLEPIDDEPWSEDNNILQLFDVMQKFKNYSWRSAAVVYYLTHVTEPDFRQNFLLFLRKLFSQYMPLYILNASRTFLRPKILKLDIEVIKSSHPKFDFQETGDNDLSSPVNINRLKQNIISQTDATLRRILLKLAAYSRDEQTELLPRNFEVEHILPKQWYATYSNKGYTKEKFDEYVEQLGNLTPLEKKLNRKLSNAPFARKKEFYLDSSIAMTRELIDEPDEWTPNAIAVRSDKLAESLIELWQKWSDDYDQ
ncbi:MAG: DUF262 domain-containing protein [Selenomonadaceae bacterium]|nr:DUF262 domain-containing protein [Selenomonadaceae bacterium]